jgi:hypothetical protein
MTEQGESTTVLAKVPDTIACRMTDADKLIVSDIMIATGVTDGVQIARAAFRTYHAELCARPGSPIKPRIVAPIPANPATPSSEG